MMTLSIGVVSLEIDVSDLPVRCMRGRNPEETLNIIRQSFFRNFIVSLMIDLFVASVFKLM